MPAFVKFDFNFLEYFKLLTFLKIPVLDNAWHMARDADLGRTDRKWCNCWQTQMGKNSNDYLSNAVCSIRMELHNMCLITWSVRAATKRAAGV